MHIEIQNCFSFWVPRPPTGASPLDPTGGLLSPRPPCTGRPPHFVPGLRPCTSPSKGGGAQRTPNICLLHVRTTQYDKHQTNAALHACEENLQGATKC